MRRLTEVRDAGIGDFGDLWVGLLLIFGLFEGTDDADCRAFGLAPFDGDLFAEQACAALTRETQLYNRDLLAMMRALSLYFEQEGQMLRRVNYGAIDVEELGSVYESLLDYRPVVSVPPKRASPSPLSHNVGEGAGGEGHPSALQNPWAGGEGHPSAFQSHFAHGALQFDLVTGTERKTTGSYYTRPELVQELIRSALLPVLDARLGAVRAQAQKHEPTRLRVLLEETLLSLRVVDPACGSGHFLLAAARRLGRELARVRVGEDQPAPEQFRLAVRDVIQRCIFGVDHNPLAVDLCKLALWIEGHCAGMPLSFLDHHIRCGNSLVGATYALVAAGMPDDAYKPVAGDVKAVAASLKKRNKKEREAQQSGQMNLGLDFADTRQHASYTRAFAHLNQLPDTSVAAVRAKAARYAELRTGAYSDWVRFHLWTAAFFMPFSEDTVENVPTSGALEEWERQPLLHNLMLKAAFELAEAVNFFHWELEFPDIFPPNVAGGFDVVLGNPPWERIKLQEQEHFVDVAAIREAPNKAAREKLIVAWRKGDAAQQAR
ncbi:MAG: hypothetical protein EI684_09195, partial [Candidatus Viridilinea halotolerans]